tara:strand:- start:16024 stop:17403 length:1380 start_codon:yes stop_codon:yes gene_type:complete
MSHKILHKELKSIQDDYNPASQETLTGLGVDKKDPIAVVAPDTVECLAAVVKLASEIGFAVVPRGGGTKMDFGFPPIRPYILVSLERLNRIVSHEPADQTVIAEAGISIASLQASLEKQGQYLPLDPPLVSSSTLGGVLATNGSGMLRSSFGSARDMVIGLKVVQANGTIVKSGGQVVKNVAGYDLNKMYIGSLGTLGILAEVTLKIQPLPEVEKIFIAQFPSTKIASDCAFRIMNSDIMPSFLELINSQTMLLSPWVKKGRINDSFGQHSCFLLGGMIGAEETVDWQIEQCEKLFSKNEEYGLITLNSCGDIRGLEFLRDFPSGLIVPSGMRRAITCRASVPPDAIESLFDLAEEQCHELSITVGMLSHFTCGHVSLVFYLDESSRDESFNGLARLITKLQEASETQGALVLEHAPLALKKKVKVWGSDNKNQEIMKMLKCRFDRKFTLNPGRFIDGI